MKYTFSQKKMAIDVSKFVKSHISLLNLERQVEIDESRALREHVNPKELQRKGLCLLKLRVRSRCTGLYGRSLVSFESNRPGSDGKLPSHSITPGDIVGLNLSGSNGQDTELGSGIVTRATQTVIVVAFDESSDNLGFDSEGPFRLIKLANDITYKRTKSALDALPKYRGGPAWHLIEVLFGETHPSPPLQSSSFDKDTGLKYFNPDLDESQQAAVKFALSQREVAIVHGPPGTGKTTTIVEIILQAVRTFNMKVLACAPSNIAVDNMVEKLARNKARVVRLGHPARLLGIVQKHSLDALVSSSESTSIVCDVRKDVDQTLAKVRKSNNASEKRQLRQEVKFLRQELRKREDGAIREILTNADVVLATTTSASPQGPLKLLKEEHFDLVVIDEVAQALEASCWIPLLRGPRCILAGDHLQLPPTIISSKAAKEGLEVTLMERLLDLLGDKAVCMLTTQYRMHEAIMKWPSQQLYHGRLQAAPSVKGHLLKDLPGVKHTEETSLPLLLIDTAGCDVYEMQVEEEVSKGNEGEADIVTAHVSSLIDAGVCPNDIAVIAPYNLQVELLRQRLSAKYPALEIKSVDGFQGREKEAVVITLVRSNDKGEVGFLSEDRRINVAITRARRHLAVVADSETVGHHDFLRSLTEYMSDEGVVRSALEYQHSCTVAGDIAQLQSSDTDLYQREKNPERKDRVERKKANDPTLSRVQSLSNHSRPRKNHSMTKQSPTDVKPTPADVKSTLADVKPTPADVKSTPTDGKSTPVDVKPTPADLKPTPADLKSTPADVKPTPADVKPTPADVKSTPTDAKPRSADVKPTPADVNPTPADVKPTPADLKPTPADVKSTPADVKPTPADVNPTPADVKPTPDVKPRSADVMPKKRRNIETSTENNKNSKSREDLESEIKSFLTEKRREILVFPASLSAQERFYVHSIAEDLNLEHESKGEGDERYIAVLKKSQRREENDHMLSTCPTCNKRLPTCNLQLHLLRCEQQHTVRPEAAPKNTEPGAESKPRNSTKKKKNASAQALKVTNDEDFDAMLAAFSKVDNECAFDSCKKSVRTLGQRCRCCDRTFCFSHHIPEVHGCGPAAKVRARQTTGSAGPKRVEPARKANIQRKMDRKLEEMSEQRAGKKRQEKK